MNKNYLFNRIAELEFVLTSLARDDMLQPGELERARDTARELLSKLKAEGYDGNESKVNYFTIQPRILKEEAEA